MEVRFELPEVKPFAELCDKFHEKVVIPFNQAFAEFKTLGGSPCFEIDPDTDQTGAVAVIAFGRLSEIEADYEDPMYMFHFAEDGTGYFFRNHRPGGEEMSGSWSEIMARVLSFIKDELNKIAEKQKGFSHELSRIEAAMLLLNPKAVVA